MKHLLLTTIAAVVLVGCGESQQSAPSPVAKPEPPTAEASGIPIHNATADGDIEAVKQHLAAGVDVNAKEDQLGMTPLSVAAAFGHKEIVELLIANGADLEAKDQWGVTPLTNATNNGHTEIVDLLRKHGGKTGEELKTEGK